MNGRLELCLDAVQVVLLAAEGETSSVCAQLADADARVAGRPFIRQPLHQRPSSDESASSSSYQL